MKDIGFDLCSSLVALERNLNNNFMQLINDKKTDPSEIVIFTDGSRNQILRLIYDGLRNNNSIIKEGT